MDKAPIIIIIIVILIVVGFFVWQNYTVSENKYPTIDPNTRGVILFYGDGCPHCKNVDDFIAENSIKQKIQFAEAEVWHNKSNAQLLGSKAQVCKLAGDSFGIPFLFDGNDKCYIGDVDIINYFKNATGIK